MRARRGRRRPRGRPPSSRRTRFRDNGCGIPEEQRKYLFIPFSTTKTKGTGLGLVITQKMIAKMGGTVEVESTEGVGTTVTLNLPRGAGAGA